MGEPHSVASTVTPVEVILGLWRSHRRQVLAAAASFVALHLLAYGRVLPHLDRRAAEAGALRAMLEEERAALDRAAQRGQTLSVTGDAALTRLGQLATGAGLTTTDLEEVGGSGRIQLGAQGSAGAVLDLLGGLSGAGAAVERLELEAAAEAADLVFVRVVTTGLRADAASPPAALSVAISVPRPPFTPPRAAYRRVGGQLWIDLSGRHRLSGVQRIGAAMTATIDGVDVRLGDRFADRPVLAIQDDRVELGPLEPGGLSGLIAFPAPADPMDGGANPGVTPGAVEGAARRDVLPETADR